MLHASVAFDHHALGRALTTAPDSPVEDGPRAIHFNSLNKSPALCQRSSGFFARQVLTSRSSAGAASVCTLDSGVGSCSRIAAMSPAVLLPSNAFLPVSI